MIDDRGSSGTAGELGEDGEVAKEGQDHGDREDQRRDSGESSEIIVFTAENGVEQDEGNCSSKWPRNESSMQNQASENGHSDSPRSYISHPKSNMINADIDHALDS